METEAKVVVILINYNSLEHTVECIESLNSQYYKNYCIVVVDNASREDELAKLQTLNNTTVLRNKHNVGFSAANNVGIKYAIDNNADFVWILNNDTVVSADCLTKMISAYNDCREKEKIGIITGKILMYYNKNIIWYAGGKINPLKGSADVAGLNKLNESSSDEILCGQYDFASGCSMLLPVSAITQCGMMSEDYFLYYEDTDYCEKIKGANLKILYCDKAELYHKEGSSTKKRSNLYTYYFSRNRLLFIKKNIAGPKKLIAYMYSYLWFVKKCLEREFTVKFVLIGIKDFLMGKTGKGYNNEDIDVGSNNS